MQSITDELRAILKDKFQAGANGFRARIEIDTPGGGDAGYTTVSYPIMRASTDKSQLTDADRCEVELDNSTGAIAIDGLLPNMPVRLYVWYGDIANEVLTFSMLIDRVRSLRHPNTVVISGRDWMKKLIVQKILLIAAQDEPLTADQPDAIRDATNYVYLNWEISDIVNDLLDKAGFAPTRHITDTGIVVDEFRGDDDEPFASAISRLADIPRYLAYCDETSAFHFEPNDLSDPRDPDYTYETGIDVMYLQRESDDDQSYTRVRATGPMTILTDAWDEVWQTGVIGNPIGAWYDPTDPGNLKVLDSHTKRIYLLQQSDQTILSSWYVGASVPYPLGLSGDPGDATIYWVLSAPWAFGGSNTGNKLHKFLVADNSLVASYNLPAGRWTDVKVSAAFIWLTDLDTDQIWKFDHTAVTPTTGYTISVGGVPKRDPTGVAVDGTTLSVFFAGRSYTVDESDPTSINGTIVSSPGMWGGEYDTDTHTELYVVGSGSHRVWKYTIATGTDYQVYAEAVDTAFEGQLGDLTGASEVRRLVVRMEAVLSLAAAQAVADAMLLKVAHFSAALDVGIIGNPALQKIDKIRVVDPVLGIASNWQVGTYRSELAGDSGTYLGTLSMKPWDPNY